MYSFIAVQLRCGGVQRFGKNPTRATPQLPEKCKRKHKERPTQLGPFPELSGDAGTDSLMLFRHACGYTLGFDHRSYDGREGSVQLNAEVGSRGCYTTSYTGDEHTHGWHGASWCEKNSTLTARALIWIFLLSATFSSGPFVQQLTNPPPPFPSLKL